MFRCAAVLGLVLITGCATAQHQYPTLAGLPAFHQVDEGFFRGGQPSSEGMRQLARLGVKTIVNVRHHSRAMEEEQRRAQQLGMRWVNISIRAWWWPTTEQAMQFLAIATDPAQRPVFVHCRQGRNRVGVMTAIYRVTSHGFSSEQAYAEGCRWGLVPWNVVTPYVIARLAKKCAGRFPAPMVHPVSDGIIHG